MAFDSVVTLFLSCRYVADSSTYIVKLHPIYTYDIECDSELVTLQFVRTDCRFRCELLAGHVDTMPLQKALPAAPGGSQPLPEGMLWLLLTGKIPTASQVEGLSSELQGRAKLPSHINGVLKTLPAGTHPMTQLSIAVMALQPASKFAQAYQQGARMLHP
jgi:hypothetical protein